MLIGTLQDKSCPIASAHQLTFASKIGIGFKISVGLENKQNVSIELKDYPSTK